MEDMIRKIIEVDKKARKITDDARSRRARSAEIIGKKKDEVRAEYMAIASRRLDVIRQDEMEQAAGRLEDVREREAQVSARLDAIAAARRAAWVDELVLRAVGKFPSLEGCPKGGVVT